MHFQQEAPREAVHLESIVGRLEEHRTPHGQGRERFLARLISESHCVGRGLTGRNMGRSSSPRSLNMASMSWESGTSSAGQEVS
jgi:hypothetical protein